MIQKHKIFGIGVLCLALWACKKKEQAIIEEADLLTEEELALLDEPELESVEDDGFDDGGVEVIPDDPSDEIEAELAKTAVKPAMEKAEPMARKSPAMTVQKGVSGNYVIQVGIYKDASQADAMKNKLSAMGIEGYIAQIENPVPDMQGTHYRVRFGYFSSIDEANAYAEKTIIPKNMDYWVDLKSRDNFTTTYARPTAPVPKIEKMPDLPKEEVKIEKKAAEKPASSSFDDDEDMDEDEEKEPPKKSIAQTKKEEAPKKFSPFKKVSAPVEKKEDPPAAVKDTPKKEAPAATEEDDSWDDDDDW